MTTPSGYSVAGPDLVAMCAVEGLCAQNGAACRKPMSASARSEVPISGSDVRALRERLGWSTYVLAKEIGCNQSTIWRIEHGAKFGGVIEKALQKLITENPPKANAGVVRAERAA